MKPLSPPTELASIVPGSYCLRFNPDEIFPYERWSWSTSPRGDVIGPCVTRHPTENSRKDFLSEERRVDLIVPALSKVLKDPFGDFNF